MTKDVATDGRAVRAFYESSPFPDYEEFGPALDVGLFTACVKRGRLTHLLAKIAWIVTLQREGGVFVTIRKKL